MQEVLYRKWRPKRFSDVFGQDHIITVLCQSLIRNHLSHAYLFCGPRGVGKTTTARLLAKGLNCEQLEKTGNPCGTCDSCLAFDQDNMIDSLEIDAASNRGIDDIRSLRDTIHFLPTRGKYKIYIIDEVHMLTKEAFNALLKTLEEPPAHVVLILATTESSKIPSTISSRCVRFDFRPLSPELLQKHLLHIAKQEHIALTEDGAMLLAEAATGSGRDALSLLQQIGLATGTLDADAIGELLGFVPDSTIETMLAKTRALDQNKFLISLQDLLDRGVDPEYYIRSMLHIIAKTVRSPNSRSWARELSPHMLLDAGEEWAWALRHIKGHPEPFIVLATAHLACAETWRATESPRVKRETSVSTVPGTKAPVVEQRVNADQPVEAETLHARQWKPGESEQELWKVFLEAVKPYNHSLAALLRDAELLEIAETDIHEVVIGVHFPFHKSRIMELKNRKILEDVLTKVTGKPYRLKCSLLTPVRKESKQGSSDEELLQAAEELFSGAK